MLVFKKDLGTKLTGKSKIGYRRFFLVKCSFCNKDFEMFAQTFKKGKVQNCKSCGVSKHKMTNSKIYSVWTSMKQRCYNKNSKKYKDYGERGIDVCKEWLESFESFYKWSIESKYKEGLTIDRKNNYKGYSPENCRWTNCCVQQSNKRLLSKRNTTKYRGVINKNKHGKYRAMITHTGKVVYLGSFKTALEAAIVRDKYIIDNNLPHTLNGLVL